MNSKQLSDLQPIDDTVAGISAALDRIATAKDEALGRAAAVRASLDAGSLTMDSKARRSAHDAAEDADLDARQLQAIAEALQPRLFAAQEAERIQAARTRHGELTAAMNEADKRWNAEYRRHIHPAIHAILKERTDLVAELSQFNKAVRANYDTAGLVIPDDDFVLAHAKLSPAELPEELAAAIAAYRLKCQQADDAKRAALAAERAYHAEIVARIESGDRRPLVTVGGIPQNYADHRR